MTDSEHEVERAAAASLTAQLAAAFTAIDAEYIEYSVEQAYRRFDGARIRLYVPLLVEHTVRDHLFTLIAARRHTAADAQTSRRAVYLQMGNS